MARLNLDRGKTIILSAPVAISLIVWGVPGMIEDLNAWSGWLTNAWSWLTETPTPISWALVMIGALILLRPQRLLHRKRSRETDTTSFDTQNTSTDYVQRYADWMTTAIQDDRGDLPGCILIGEPHICWEHLEVKRGDAYIEFNFDIWNSSVLLLEINKQVEGHIWFQEGELERTPEITQKASQLSHLRRSRAAQITVRQWLSFTVKAEMKIEYGRQVEFDFSKVNISVMATLPDGSQGHTFRLPIPNVVHAQMPQHPNAPVPDKEGSQNEQV